MMSTEHKRLLIVDDDAKIIPILRDAFEAEGYEVAVFADAPAVLRYIQTYGLPHLALIDLELPSMHGFDLSEKLKALGDVPIIFLTGNAETDTIVDALTHYADDYVTKPFKIRELAARVRRVLSRFPDFDYAQHPVLQVDGHLSIDFGLSRLLIGGQPVLLTPTEASLLHILIRNAGQVVTTDTLIARVWPADEVYEDTLRVHMHRLRRKIEPDLHTPRYIQTERGIGYRFVPTDFKSIPRTSSAY